MYTRCMHSFFNMLKAPYENIVDQDTVFLYRITLDRQQAKKTLTIDKSGPKIAINSVFDCHLSPVWQQMAFANSVSNDFLLCVITRLNEIHLYIYSSVYWSAHETLVPIASAADKPVQLHNVWLKYC